MSTSKTEFFPLLSAGFQKLSTTAETIANATLEPTGFADPANVVITYSHADRTITLSHSSGTIKWWWRGEEKSVASPWTSAAHTNTPTEYFLTISGDISTAAWSTTPWTFDKVQVAFVEYNTLAVDSFAIRETHGLMQWQAHRSDHANVGTYKTSGLTLTEGTFAINGTTDEWNTWGLEAGAVRDEDLDSTIAAWIRGTYTLLRRDGASGTWIFNTTATLPFHVVANTIQYNQNTSSTWQLTPVPEDNFVNYYIAAVPTTADADSQKHRVWVIPGQAVYTTVTAAQQEFPLNLDLGTLTTLAPEFVSVVRVTMRYNASGGGALTTTGRCNIAAVTNLTGSRANQTGSAAFSPADHGGLSGLGDDDHLQYELIAGRAANVVTETTNFTMLSSVILYLVDTSGGNITVTLLDPATVQGKIITFLNKSTNNITFGSYPIAGVTNFTIDGNERIQLVSDGVAWRQYARKTIAFWKTGITYCKDAVIEVSETGFEGLWRCITQHTASAAFATDVAANWDYVAGERCARWINVAHSFSAGDWIYDNGSGWALADCDDAATAEVVGVVSAAVTNYFLLVTDGYFKRTTGTFTRGATQFLSATAGAATETEPSTVGQISKPLGVATSTTEMNVNIMRGSVVGGANLYSTIGLANNATTSFHTIQGVAGTGGWISGTIRIDATTDYVIPFFCHFSRQLDGTTYNVSPSFGDSIPSGLAIVNSGSSIQVTLPNLAGFVSASVTYCVQAAANGTTLPVSVSASSVLGSTTGSAPAAGVIGEEKIAEYEGSQSLTANTWTDRTATSITLTPGVWEVSAYMHANNVAPSGFTYWAIGITAVAGDNAPSSYGRYIARSGTAPTSSLAPFLALGPQRVTVSANTTLYLKGFVPTGTTGFSLYGGGIRAIRIG